MLLATASRYWPFFPFFMTYKHASDLAAEPWSEKRVHFGVMASVCQQLNARLSWRVAVGFMSLLVHSASLQAGNSVIYSHSSVQSASEPVPILDMISGWDGPFQPGRYAYGDVRWVLGIQSGRAGQRTWFLERESRWHYSLDFSRGMSRYYRALEQGDELENAESLALAVRAVEAHGVRLGRDWALANDDWGNLGMTAALALYRAGHHQFGQLAGNAESGRNGAASATLDYHFDEDKILEFQPDDERGQGLSLDLGWHWSYVSSHQSRWTAELLLQDAWNQWRFDRSGYTRACINFDDPEDSVCESRSTASGQSGTESFIGRLQPTVSAQVTHQSSSFGAAGVGQLFELSYFQHHRYRRLGVGSHYELPSVGRLGLSVHSSRQLGAHYRFLSERTGFHIDLMTDDRRLGFARDIEASLGLSLGW